MSINDRDDRISSKDNERIGITEFYMFKKIEEILNMLS